MTVANCEAEDVRTPNPQLDITPITVQTKNADLQGNLFDELGPVVVQLRLCRGKVALIDSDMAEKVLPYKWYLNRTGYAISQVLYAAGRQFLLHRLVLGLGRGRGIDVHHVNGDKLDNRRVNLEVVSHREHLQRHFGRLSPEVVCELRERYVSGERCVDLASEVGVTPQYLSRVMRRSQVKVRRPGRRS